MYRKVSRVRIPPSPYKFKYPRFFAGGILIYTVIWSKANCLALRRDEKPGAMFLFERDPHRQMRVTLTSAKGKNREGGCEAHSHMGEFSVREITQGESHIASIAAIKSHSSLLI